MRLKTIMIERSVTINLGDFESVKLTAALEAELDEDDDVKTVAAGCDKQLRELLYKQAQGTSRPEGMSRYGLVPKKGATKK